MGDQGIQTGKMGTGAQASAPGVTRGGYWVIKAESGQVMGTVVGSSSSDVLAKCLCSHLTLCPLLQALWCRRHCAPALASTLGSNLALGKPFCPGLLTEALLVPEGSRM